jgi:hypothetical protein
MADNLDTDELGEELDDLEARDDDENEPLTADEIERRDAIKEFLDEVGTGETLIHEDNFKDHAQQFAEELGLEIANAWPYNCIDWERAADELRADYTSVTFDGEDYLYRA